MSDYSEQGAVLVEDAAVDHPPTVDELLERQRREQPETAASSTMRGGQGRSSEEQAALEAGGEQTGEEIDGGTGVEGPNSD